MAYPTKRSSKPDELLPEEQEVVAALSAYETVFDNDDISLDEFVTTHDLYETYRRHALAVHSQPGFGVADPEEAPIILAQRQFGAAIRRVWPGIEAYKVYRMKDGRRQWGFVGVRGPESITVQDNPGRGRKRDSDEGSKG